MPFCATCGAAVEGRFCAKCGSAVAADAPPVSAMPAGAGPQPAMAASAPMADNVVSMLCYFTFIPAIIFLVIAPYNQNKVVRFHAFQSIFFCIAWIIFRVGTGIVLGVLGMFGFWSMIFLSLLIGLGGFCLWLYLVISAYQGKMVELPLIGPLARQQA